MPLLRLFSQKWCLMGGEEAAGILKGYFAGSLSPQMGSFMTNMPRPRTRLPSTSQLEEAVVGPRGMCGAAWVTLYPGKEDRNIIKGSVPIARQ